MPDKRDPEYDNAGCDHRKNSSPSPRHKRALKLRNITCHSEAYDTLHQKAIEPTNCSSLVCLGSVMQTTSSRPLGTARTSEEVLRHAKDFLDQYFTSIKRLNSPAHKKRWSEVISEVTSRATYDLTETELVYGAKLAWRNAQRCIGRIQWSKLQVFDARYVTTAGGMFEALCNHIKYATNKGNIRSAITIFPQRSDGKHDYRIWNNQLISYAGYRQADGSVLGDPLTAEFTEVCLKLGWKGKGGRFDILPLVLSASGHDPEYFDIPQDLILEVPLIHPKYPWFADLGIKWYALPAVSNMLFDVGGLEFTAAPFNGWYMVTEIACRDLCDSYRYNILPEVAKKLGLDTSSPTTLWKDRALVEVNIAVLHSFQSMNVTIVDHHTATESFMKHFENEQRLRGGCPTDWVWIVPPMSGSVTPVFHQEMLVYTLKPSYEYQGVAWKIHVWKKDKEKNNVDRRKSTRKFRFKEIARAVKFTSKLFGKALSRRIKATVLYATETGKSENYAKTLCEIFSHAFNAKVHCMTDYDMINLEHEALVLVVTSTFGNGDPPENGEEFARNLHAMKMMGTPSSSEQFGHQSKSFIKMNSQTEIRSERNSRSSSFDHISQMDDFEPLSNVRFAVFALGSSAYPNFCAFGKYVDNLLAELGGENLLRLRTGDELGGQEQAFRAWARDVFQIACEVFCVGDDVTMNDVTAALQSDSLWSRGKARLVEVASPDVDITKGLMKIHNKPVVQCKLISRQYLQAPFCSRKTMLLRLDTSGAAEIAFNPGDHVGIHPVNRKELVDAILARIHNPPPDDQVVEIQLLKEHQTPNGMAKTWSPHERLPPCTLTTALSYFLDITSAPAPQVLKVLAAMATDEADRKRLNELATDAHEYESWKSLRFPNLPEVLMEFPSVSVDATALLTLLPPLQPRFYSISSSPLVHPGQIHVTVALVSYEIQVSGSTRIHYGVSSGYLDQLPENSSLNCFIRGAPNFQLPNDPSVPIILVGPGTGIAPFRSFWQHRRQEIYKNKNQRRFGKMTLFFGCQDPDVHLYNDETTKLKLEGVLHQVYTAYSRLPNKPKVYVQDLMRQVGSEIYQQIFVEKGHFYVCGDVAMAEDVCGTLRSLIATYASLSPEAAEAYVLSLRDENRYHEDIFGITFRTPEVRSRPAEEKSEPTSV